jgi:hypothetical protein
VISLLHSLVLHLCWKVLVCLIVDLFRHEEFLVKFGRVVPIEGISAERERLLSQTYQDFRQVSKLQIIMVLLVLDRLVRLVLHLDSLIQLFNLW